MLIGFHLPLPWSQQSREVRESIVPGTVPLYICMRWPCQLHLWLPKTTDTLSAHRDETYMQLQKH